MKLHTPDRVVHQLGNGQLKRAALLILCYENQSFKLTYKKYEFSHIEY